MLADKKLYLQDEDGRTRICVPWTEKRTVIATIHAHNLSAHPGMAKTKFLAKQYFYWPRIDRDIEDAVNGCEVCIKAKLRKQQASVVIPAVQLDSNMAASPRTTSPLVKVISESLEKIRIQQLEDHLKNRGSYNKKVHGNNVLRGNKVYLWEPQTEENRKLATYTISTTTLHISKHISRPISYIGLWEGIRVGGLLIGKHQLF
nr:uncharacterized protein LOC121130776 [Lepeophtheirus salmonis]